MALPLTVESTDAIPEAQRELYVERDGAFHLDVDGLPDVGGLKSALDAERQRAKEQRAKASEAAKRASIIEDLGGDDGVKQLLDLKNRIEQDEELKLFTEGNRDAYNERLTGRLKTDYEKRLAAVTDKQVKAEKQLAETHARLERQMIGGQIKDAAASLTDIVPEAIKTVERIGGDTFVMDENGEIVAKATDGSIELGSDGKPLTVAEWVAGLRDSHPFFFRAPSGGGAQSSGAPNGKLSAEAVSRMSMAEYQKARADGRIS